MSRICAKNLPKYVTEDRLREFFSQKGEVTDVKLMRTKDGKSRQFGFVGYRTEHEAEEAIKYFNKSFMDTCRITCEIAWKVGDPNIPRPWSRYSTKIKENTSTEDKRTTGFRSSKAVVLDGDSQKSKNGNDNGDPQFLEFLQVMQPRSQSKLWANDTLAASSLNQNKVASSSKIQMKKGCENKLDGMDSELESLDEEGSNNSSEKQDAENPINLVHDEVVSDMDYFWSRIKEWSDSENDGYEVSADHNDFDFSDGRGNFDNKSNNSPAKDMLEPDISKGEAGDGSSGEHGIIESASHLLNSTTNENDNVLEYGRLFIRNLPYAATEEELREHFSKYGSISQVHIVVDKDTKRSKGIAYVLFALPDSAARALEEMDNSIFQGRLLHVMPAKQKNLSDKASNFNEQSSKTFKQQREEERKASEAGGNTRAWNSLYMCPDTVRNIQYEAWYT